ncbi:MAG: hypothetical protein V3S51_04555 [Dehalococcoidia bacterium]
MDWDSIIPLISVLVFAVGLPLLLRAKKKGGSKKEDELLSHLQGTGVKAHLLEGGSDQEKMWRQRSFGERSEGAIGIDDRNMDSVRIVGVSSQHDSSRYLDYLVRRRDAQKTRKTLATTAAITLEDGTVVAECSAQAYMVNSDQG